jgi:hypothetical protein
MLYAVAPFTAVQLKVAAVSVRPDTDKLAGVPQFMMVAAVVNCAAATSELEELQLVVTRQSYKVEAVRPDNVTVVLVVLAAATCHVVELPALNSTL